MKRFKLGDAVYCLEGNDILETIISGMQTEYEEEIWQDGHDPKKLSLRYKITLRPMYQDYRDDTNLFATEEEARKAHQSLHIPPPLTVLNWETSYEEKKERKK